MSQKDKLLKRFYSKPSDLTWEEFVRVFEYYGFTLSNGNGSRRAFYDNQKRVHYAHQPHPKNIVKAYALKQAIEFLNNLDQTYIPQENEN